MRRSTEIGYGPYLDAAPIQTGNFNSHRDLTEFFSSLYVRIAQGVHQELDTVL